MRTRPVALAVGMALALCTLGTVTASASTRKARIVRAPPLRVIVTTPVETPVPYWDSNIVPRYRYRPEDDRVDPYGPPVVPVVRYYGGWY